MLLSIAALTALVGTCAPAVASKDLIAIARTESGLETLAVHDNTARQSYHPAEKGEALILARQLLQAGHSLDIGLMQINTGNFRWLDLTLDTAFEPCASLHAAATHLTAISRYNTGDPARGFQNGYVQRVVAAGLQPEPPAGVAPEVETPKSEAVEPHNWEVFPEEDPQPAEPPKSTDPTTSNLKESP